MQRKTGKVYIGLVGEKGGGKDSVVKIAARLLPRKKVVQIRFSDVLTDTLNIWALPRTRENYQKLSPSFRKVYGPHTLANAVRVRGEAAPADIVFLNGVRWWEDVKMLRSLNKRGARSFLVYVTASASLRYERIRKNKRKEKVGEYRATLRKFMKEEKAYTEIFIPKIGRKADVKIENIGSYENLREVVKRQILPRITGRKPS